MGRSIWRGGVGVRKRRDLGGHYRERLEVMRRGEALKRRRGKKIDGRRDEIEERGKAGEVSQDENELPNFSIA